jgi:hypothetical protein
MLMLIEVGLVLIAILLAFRFPRLCAGWFSAAERGFAALARRQRLSVLVVMFAALGARALIFPVLPEPQPSINDEFSYLLAADTFAHGHVTNPAHPMWVHFETFHVIQQPSYASMYPPAQGLILALGQVITGHPFVGVWLSMALLCAAICWMLQAWLPPSWALLGGMLAVIRLGTFSYWANSYWGGAAAATGAALMLGALPRIKRSQRPGDALLMGLGLAILANSRPYEGLILSLPVAIALLIWIFRTDRPPWRVLIPRVLLPLVLVAAATAAGMGYYFWRVTGSPFRMPYQVDRAAYAVAPYFLWQSPRPQPVYHHPGMQDFYLHNELDFYKLTHSITGVFALTTVKAVNSWVLYLGPVLTLPFIMVIATASPGLSWATLSRQTQFLLGAGAVLFAGLAAEVFFLPHYAAPMVCIIFALVLKAMRRLRGWRWKGMPTGLFLTRAVPAICLLMLVVRTGAAPLRLPLTPDWPPTWYNSKPVRTDRARILAELEAYPEKHLVIVRYRPHSKAKYDWVYNKAEIDNAKIVWARDMGAARNQELVNYFRDRRVWLVEPDEEAPKLEPYLAQPSGL